MFRSTRRLQCTRNTSARAREKRTMRKTCVHDWFENKAWPGRPPRLYGPSPAAHFLLPLDQRRPEALHDRRKGRPRTDEGDGRRATGLTYTNSLRARTHSLWLHQHSTNRLWPSMCVRDVMWCVPPTRSAHRAAEQRQRSMTNTFSCMQCVTVGFTQHYSTANFRTEYNLRV